MFDSFKKKIIFPENIPTEYYIMMYLHEVIKFYYAFGFECLNVNIILCYVFVFICNNFFIIIEMPGRKPGIPPSVVIDAVLKFKDRIVLKSDSDKGKCLTYYFQVIFILHNKLQYFILFCFIYYFVYIIITLIYVTIISNLWVFIK